ncbi:MAG: dTMP kinase [Candidatus Diapherotrites archaeon]
MKGQLIVIEGTDASGKATQTKLLLNHLRKKRKKAVLMSFPRYNTFFGKIIGKYLSGEFGSKEKFSSESAVMLYALDKYSASDEIEKKLSQGFTVILDRYTASNIAHQGAKFTNTAKRNQFIKWVKNLESTLPKPTFTFFLDVPVPISQKLMKGTDRTKKYRKGKTKDIHESDLKYLERTRKIYLQLAKQKNWKKINCVSNSKLKSKEEIHQEILKTLKP